MEIDEAIDQLRLWCDASAGAPIQMAGGRLMTFRSTSRYSCPLIRHIEQELGCSLPESYKKFMAAVGECTLFVDAAYGGGITFYAPEDAIKSSQRIWDEEEVPGVDRFCFVGAHMAMGDYIGFAISRDGPQNFDVFCHEYPPQEYVAVSDELSSWRSFESWLIHAVENNGQDTL
jgi:hypothetical protein